MNVPNQSIAFTGLVRDGFGIALWQADGSGPEPAAKGHTFVTPIEPITAHYYIASRDYVDVSARGGIYATALIGAWPRLAAALSALGRKTSDLVIRLPLTTAGPDREGEDWFYRDGVETRYLQPQAPLPVSLQGNALLELAPTRLVLTEDYRDARAFADVRISLVSQPTPVSAVRGVAEGPFAALAQAFLADLGGRPVRFVVDSIQLTARTFAGHGRTSARFAEIPRAHLEVG